MGFDLAKKLKDAGFPIGHDFSIQGGLAVPPRCVCGVMVGSDEPHTPTFSELIKACGKPLSLVEDEKGFRVWLTNSAGGSGNTSIWYESFEEAVAELWLELNKK